MKPKTESNIFFMIGSILCSTFIILSLIGLYYSVDQVGKISCIIGLLFGVILFIGCWLIGVDIQTTHIERILKKNNLWQDERIKKDELK